MIYLLLFPDCSRDFRGQMNCPNSFPETNLFSKNQRLLVKCQEKNFPQHLGKNCNSAYDLGKRAGLCPAIFSGTPGNLE